MRRFHYTIIVCLILFSLFSVYFLIPDENNFVKDADEGYYFRSARLIAQRGVLAFRQLVKSFNSDPKAIYNPLPSRIGHTILTASWFKIFGSSYVSLARFSFLCYLLFVAFSFYFCAKFFGKDIAYLFCLLLSSSPLLMAMGKRALLDANANLFWALSVWTFLDFLSSPRRYKFIIFLLIFSFTITVKESSLLLTLFFVISYLVHKYYFKNTIPDRYLFGIVFVPALAVGISYIILLGGPMNLLALAKSFVVSYLWGARISPYTALFCSGPWYRYIIDYLLLSPLTTLLCLGYLGHILVSRIRDWKTAYFLSYLLVVFAISSAFRFPKVVRYVMSLDTAVCLFSVFMLRDLFKQGSSKRQASYVFISAVTIFFVNYQNFISLFALHNIYDPVSYWLLLANRMLPFYP